MDGITRKCVIPSMGFIYCQTHWSAGKGSGQRRRRNPGVAFILQVSDSGLVFNLYRPPIQKPIDDDIHNVVKHE